MKEGLEGVAERLMRKCGDNGLWSGRIRLLPEEMFDDVGMSLYVFKEEKCKSVLVFECMCVCK